MQWYLDVSSSISPKLVYIVWRALHIRIYLFTMHALQASIIHTYMHMQNVLKPQRSGYINRSGHAPHVWLGLAHTLTTSVPPSLDCYMLRPASSCLPPQPCTSSCCSHAHIIRLGTCLPFQLSGGALPSLLYRVLWVQKRQMDNGSFLFLWQATAQPLRSCFMGSPFWLTSSFGTQHWLRLTHLYTSR